MKFFTKYCELHLKLFSEMWPEEILYYVYQSILTALRMQLVMHMAFYTFMHKYFCNLILEKYSDL